MKKKQNIQTNASFQRLLGHLVPWGSAVRISKAHRWPTDRTVRHGTLIAHFLLEWPCYFLFLVSLLLPTSSPGPVFIYLFIYLSGASLVAEMVKNLLAMQETFVWSLDWEDPLEKGMATYSSTLAWRIPWREEPVGLQSMGSQRGGHWACMHILKRIRRKNWHLEVKCYHDSNNHHKTL